MRCACAIKDFTGDEKQNVLEKLEPVLNKLLQLESDGLETETLELLTELGVYNHGYEELVSTYIESIEHDKHPEFYRDLILHKYHDKAPMLRARLMVLHGKSSNSIRSKLRAELPYIR